MTRQRTVPVLVLAILQLILGGLGLFCMVCTGTMKLSGADSALKQNQQRPPFQVRFEQLLEQAKKDRLPLDNVMTTSFVASGWLCSLLLVTGGMGLLNMAPWGRWLGIAYAFISILFTLINAVYEIIARNPVTREVVNQLGPPQTPQDEFLMRAMEVGFVASYVMPLVQLVFPVVTLIILNLRSTRQAFAGELPESDEDDPTTE